MSTELESAAARVRDVFDRFEEVAEVSEQAAERALAILAHQTCEFTDWPINLGAGY